MSQLWILFAVFLVVLAHPYHGHQGNHKNDHQHDHHHGPKHVLSDIYKQYQAEGHHMETVDFLSRPVYTQPKVENMKDLFFPPLPGQSHVDFHPQLRVVPGPNDPLTYYSWHIHMYFFQEDKNVTKRCLALRTEFMNTFNVPTCTGNCFMGGPFDNCTQGICVWDPYFGVDGPHPYGQWGVYLPNELVADTLSWMSANRGEFQVLFHPNTGLMVGDHDPARRAIWLGTQVPLDLDFLVWLQCKWFGCNNGKRSIHSVY